MRLMELFAERQSTPQEMSQETKLCTPGDAELVGHSITEFHYNTNVISSFPNWFARYENLFVVYLKELTDDWKVRLLLRKLGSAERDRYSNYILPKHPRDDNFTETVEIQKIFGESISLLFHYLHIP